MPAASVLMGFLLLLIGPRYANPFVAPPSSSADLVGSWLGTLQAGAFQLRVVFHISRDPDGVLSATLDSPDQGATGIPVDTVVVKGDTLHMEVRAVLGAYEGTISRDGMTIDGEWRQSGQVLALVLKRTDEMPVARRPQEPKPPFPYDEETVVFDNVEAGVTLAGTLTKPRTGGPFPAVVLISGSGPQDRDEALLGHKPFLVLADYLTRQGLVVLRFDDRGVGASTGTFATATSEDFAGDVLAAVAYLKGRPDVDPAGIGLAGHSEGGLIAPMAAVRSADVAYLVLMAGPGLSGEEILYRQAALIARASGTSEEAIDQNRARQQRLFEVLKTEPDRASAAAQLRTILMESMAAMSDEEKRALGLTGSDVETVIERQVEQINAPWFRFFLTYDPAPTLRKVTCPVLAVNGDKDLQVPSQANLEAIDAALRDGGNTAVTTMALEGLNHLFQTAATGAPSEYATIEETFSPEALAVIGDWIVAQTSRP